MKQRTGKVGAIDLPADLLAELEGMEFCGRARSDAWTASEHGVIRKYYGTLGPSALAAFFLKNADALGSPRVRSKHAIQAQASKLGIHFDRHVKGKRK